MLKLISYCHTVTYPALPPPHILRYHQPQISNLSLDDKLNFINASYEDDLQWKMTMYGNVYLGNHLSDHTQVLTLSLDDQPKSLE